MLAKSVLVRPQGLRPQACTPGRVPPLGLFCYATDHHPHCSSFIGTTSHKNEVEFFLRMLPINFKWRWILIRCSNSPFEKFYQTGFDSQLGHTKDLKMVSAASLALTLSI